MSSEGVTSETRKRKHKSARKQGVHERPDLIDGESSRPSKKIKQNGDGSVPIPSPPLAPSKAPEHSSDRFQGPGNDGPGDLDAEPTAGLVPEARTEVTTGRDAQAFFKIHGDFHRPPAEEVPRPEAIREDNESHRRRHAIRYNDRHPTKWHPASACQKRCARRC